MSSSFLRAASQRAQDALPRCSPATGAAAVHALSEWSAAKWRAAAGRAVDGKVLEQSRADRFHSELEAAADEPTKVAMLSAQYEKMR
eukprot:936756-Prymnesium_polylepis.1